MQQAIEPRAGADAGGAIAGPGSSPETGAPGPGPARRPRQRPGRRGLHLQHGAGRPYTKPNPQGTVGGFKVERYVDAARPRVRLLRLDAALPDQPDRRRGRRQRARHVGPDEPGAHRQAGHPGDALAARVAGRQPEARRARRGARQPGLLPGNRRRLRHLRGLPPSGAQVVDARPASSATRAAWRPTGAPSTRPRRAPRRSSRSTSPTSRRRCRCGSGPYDSHGLSISADGNRAYVAGVDSGLIILDVSEIQARKPNPQVREIARLQWDSMSIPQNAIPVTIDGHPYVVEIDEFGTLDEVGAGRIIDIADETKPRVISNLRLEVHQPENFDQIGGDPRRGPAAAGLRRPLLQRPDAGRSRDRRLLDDPLGPAGLRHPRPASTRARSPTSTPRSATRLTPGFAASQLGDVEPLVRPRARRDLVLGRLPGLLRGQADQRRLAVPEAARAATSTLPAHPPGGGSGADVISGAGERDRIATRGGKDRVCAQGGARPGQGRRRARTG